MLSIVRNSLISLILGCLLLNVPIAFGATVTYSYDTLNRLTSVDYGNGTTINYTYDPAGNRLTMVALTDSDADGLPDAWEMATFGNLTTANGTSDYDGDSYTDLTEYQSGTDPKVYTSAPGPITIYVDDDNTSGPYQGSPAYPFNTLQDSIDASRTSDTIHVRSGSYTGPVVISKDNISLIGDGAILTVSDAVNSGAAIDISGRSNIHIEGFTLQNGQADFGGGIDINNSSNVTIKANVLIGNTANISGGGMAITGNSSSMSIRNNVLANNSAATSGGGIYMDTTGTNIEIVNNTIAGNTSPNSGIHVENGSPTIRNTILCNNGPGDLYGVPDTAISYSLICDGTYDGINNNITGNPKFVDTGNNNYHLTACSPAVDAGDPADDYSQEPAPNGARINMGAYGNTPEAAVTPDPTDTDTDTIVDACDNCTLVANPDQRDTNGDGYGNMCDGDLNNDGNTNATDLTLFKQVYRGSDPDADFNGDGLINATDLTIFKGLYRKPPGPSGLVP